jgi:multidrug efflux system membrane fusion protein
MRPVVLARNTNGEAVIDNGLAPGETIVTDGQLLLTPGARVSIKNHDSSQKEAGKK